MRRTRTALLGLLTAALLAAPAGRRLAEPGDRGLEAEKLAGEGVWVDPHFAKRFPDAKRVRASVWFEDQVLGDGKAYARRAEALNDWKRSDLRTAMVATLKRLSRESWAGVEERVKAHLASGAFANLRRHWIVNGFSCGVTEQGLAEIQKLPGVRKVFAARLDWNMPRSTNEEVPAHPEVRRPPFDPQRYKHPWYVRYLLADRVWRDFGVAGKGTLNVIHDHNFVFSDNSIPNAHRNPGETPANGKDDDGNGWIDDYHGFNFEHDSPVLARVPVAPDSTQGRLLHGYMCAAVVCGTGAEGKPYEFGIAPEARWAGVISMRHMEAAVEWAVEQGADTYSMSFSAPNRGEYRSHWRKIMEHGALCGICFVSGAGNNGVSQKVPLQMRQPEDIPHVVFSAAGVQRDLGRTPTSSKGPVEWNTEHYKDGTVPKPEVCAFNFNLPLLRPDGTVLEGGIGGNSFAGPMFCGTIALMRSADPEIQAWTVREIITATATDVAAEGFDYETGHGLINCYRAVREVLRRKALREGRPTKPFEGRTAGDELDVAAHKKRLVPKGVVVFRIAPNGQAKDLGVQPGDLIESYNGKPVISRVALRAATQAARQEGVEEIPVVLRRGTETIELTFQPGRLGVFALDRYDEPVFR